MSQDRWKELVVGKLYGELSPDEDREFEEVCRADPSCAAEFEALSSVRRRLSEVRHRPIERSGEGRVLVLPSRRRRVTPWGFGAGFAAAAALLIVGFLLGQSTSPPPTDTTLTAGSAQPRSELEGLDVIEVQDRQAQFDRRISALESGIPRAAASRPGSLRVMPGQEAFSRDDLLQLANRVSYERESDLAYVLQEIAQMENRMMNRVQTNETLVRVLLTRQQAAETPTR